MTVTTQQPGRTTVRDFVYCDEELTYAVNRHNRDDPENRLTKEMVEDVRDLILDFCDEHEVYSDEDEVFCVIDLTEEQTNEMGRAIQLAVTRTNLYTITSETAHMLSNIIFQECIRNSTLTVTGLCGEQTVRMVGNLQAKVLSTTH